MESVRELNRDKPMKLATSRWGVTAYEMISVLLKNPKFRAKAWDTEREFETTGKTDKRSTAGRGKD